MKRVIILLWRNLEEKYYIVCGDSESKLLTFPDGVFKNVLQKKIDDFISKNYHIILLIHDNSTNICVQFRDIKKLGCYIFSDGNGPVYYNDTNYNGIIKTIETNKLQNIISQNGTECIKKEAFDFIWNSYFLEKKINDFLYFCEIVRIYSDIQNDYQKLADKYKEEIIDGIDREKINELIKFLKSRIKMDEIKENCINFFKDVGLI